MEGEVLREFLVRLGFDVNKASSKFFDDKVSTATKNVLKLGAAAASVAAAVTYAVTKISEKLDDLYFASQRIGASVVNIQAFGYAVAQMGGSAAGALASLENVARFIRTSPGAIDLIKSLGVRTTDENGQLRDTVDMMSDLGDVLRKMPYYQANAYAGVLGIDEKTLMALREGTSEFADEYRDLTKRAGLDSQRAAKDAHSFMNEIRGLNAAVGVLMQKFTSLLSGRMAASMRATREYFVANFDRIANAIEVVVDTVGRIVTAVTTLFVRGVEVVSGLVDWFRGLDDGMAGSIKALALFAAGWVVLNTVIGLSPLGIVLALGAAILALYDDYKTWKDGGKSLINWAEWEPAITAATDALNGLGRAFQFVYEWQKKWAELRGLKTTPISLNDVQGEKGDDVMRRALGLKPRASAKGNEAPDAPNAASGAPRVGVARGEAGTPLKAGPTLNTEGAMQFFQSAGWTKEQSAGIVANLKAESGLDPEAVGDGGKAYGIAQWHPARQRAFEQVMGKPIRGSSAEEQMKFLQYEVTQGAEKHAGDVLRATRSADLAGQVFSDAYERPADREGEAQKRGESAVSIAQTTNITVHGGGPETAQQVASAQGNVNQQLVRNTKGALR